MCHSPWPATFVAGHGYSTAMVVGEFMEDVDVVVIGGGPAGYACAFAASAAGRDVIIVDPRESLGGACLHEGCVPTKTLLHALATSDDRSAESLIARVDTDRVRLGQRLETSAEAQSVRIVRGTARFLGPRELQVASDEVARFRFANAVICTGSKRREGEPIPECDRVISPNLLPLNPSLADGRVTVLGNDAIAVEAATIAAGLGAETTLVPCGATILPDIPRPLVEPMMSTALFTVSHDNIPDIPKSDLVIDARDRTASLDGLGLEDTSVAIEDGWIQVDEHMRTSARRILAAGDCVGPPLWAGAAMHRGRIAAETIVGASGAWDPATVAQLVYTNPEICWCGDMADCDPDDASFAVPWSPTGLSIAVDTLDGVAMVRWNRSTGIVTGAGATGRDACKLADGFTTAVEMAATLQDLADMVPSHPIQGDPLSLAAREAIASS